MLITSFLAHVLFTDVRQSITGIHISPPSVLLNADAIRAYLDKVHGPHHILPRAVSPRQAHQSPLLQLISSKVVIEISAERMPAIDIGHSGTRKSLFTLVSAVQPDLTMAPVPSITPELHTQHSRPMKREGSQESVIASHEPLKVFPPDVGTYVVPHGLSHHRSRAWRSLPRIQPRMTLLNQLEGVPFTIRYDLRYHNLFCYTMLCVLSSRCDVC
ncbi:hypothetical protein BC827DRAFT_952523 [Russula dissimulans]|nr:hypothetical protein BC827DRAFT_952523 [Russula dissimulans]